MVQGFLNNEVRIDRVAVTRQDISTSATITNLDSSKGFIRMTGSTATSLQGITAGYAGQGLTIYNVSTATVTIKHQNSGASASDRIITPSGYDESLFPNSIYNFIYDGSGSRWLLQGKPVNPDTVYYKRSDAAGFSRASTSTVTVTHNDTNQTIFVPGLPVRYKENSGDAWLYGVIKSYSSGTVTIGGVSLPSTLFEFQVGPSLKLVSVPVQIGGTLTVADDQIKTIMKTALNWRFSEAYLVYASGMVESAANGSDLHIMIANNSASTDVLTGVLNLAQSTNAVDTGITINSSNYKLSFGNKIFINVDQVGSTDAGSDLTLSLLFAFPDIII